MARSVIKKSYDSSLTSTHIKSFYTGQYTKITVPKGSYILMANKIQYNQCGIWCIGNANEYKVVELVTKGDRIPTVTVEGDNIVISNVYNYASIVLMLLNSNDTFNYALS